MHGMPIEQRFPEERLMAFWVYILRCADGSYYTGHTDNVEKRLGEHAIGAIPSCYTFNRRPLELVLTHEFTTRSEALISEQQIKGWSHKKKEAMIRGDWAEVSRLARSTKAFKKPSVHPEPPSPVRPELVEGLGRPVILVHPEPTSSVHPELVEGQSHIQTMPVKGVNASLSGSTARQARCSPRTEKALL
jgi:putative endonuclease